MRFVDSLNDIQKSIRYVLRTPPRSFAEALETRTELEQMEPRGQCPLPKARPIYKLCARNGSFHFLERFILFFRPGSGTVQK
jgi:hypothetical protein